MHSQEGSNALFSFATEGILITDKNGIITQINPAGVKMFGYEEQELIGQPIEILIPKRHSGKHLDDRNKFIQNPRARSMGIGMNLFGLRKDQSEFPVEISLSPYNRNNEPFVIAFIIDITVRKKTEDEIHRKKEELEQITRDLMISNAELENFAYISSHDLQEPLRKIRAFGDRLQITDQDNLSEQGKDYLNRMLNAAERMQVLISDLLTFSRLTTRAQPFQEVDLSEILKGVLSDLEVAIENNNVKIDFDQLPAIEAEPTQIRQLFQNIISNAIKFRHKHIDPEISIKTSEVTIKNMPAIEIIIQDNGIGFDNKYADRIFNIFQRLEGKKYEGSGIGLAICKKIVLMHDGQISVSSRINEGTAFTITLPKYHPINPKSSINYEKQH